MVKAALSIAARVVALTIIMFACFASAGSIVAQPQGPQPPEGAATTAGALLAVCLLDTCVLTHLILRSRWWGWRLAATVFAVFYGVMTFMSQIESAVFLTNLPAGMLPRLFLAGAVIAAPFSALAVLILGKRSAGHSDAAANTRLVMPQREWAWKLGLIVLAYLTLYFTFGYYLAWREPAVPAYYGGIDEGSFLRRMSSVITETPWLIPFQMLRALLWVAIALPVIRATKGSWLETSLALGFLFSVVMTAPLLLPNAFMPEAVRMAHLRETASSNFIFGLLIGWLLARRQEATGVAVPLGPSTA